MAKPTQPGVTSTEVVHAGVPRRRAHGSLAPAIEQTSTFTFGSTAEIERFLRGEDPDPDRQEYSRHGNPTVREVERRMAALEGAEDALLFASGMAAITTALMAITKAGDHVVLFRDCYRRTRQFVSATLGRFGVSHSLVPEGDLRALAEVIGPRTRAVVVETPTNPFLACVDLEALVAACRPLGRPRILVDATFASPFNMRPIRSGADLVVHSASKYLAGHNDVLGGVVSGSSSLLGLIRDLRGVLGGVCDPHAAFLIGRGLKTLALRMEKQNTSALAIARALELHPKIDRVFYPMLPSHPSHGAAQRQLRGGGGVVSFVVKGGRGAAARLVDRCKLAYIAPSLGGVETLIEQPAVMSYAELDDEQLAVVGIPPGLIRLAVGIEEPADILADLRAALDGP